MIVLVMIVKNESHVIRRCLESVKPFVDGWVIADTGSMDGTQDIVHEVMGDVPGNLIEREWVDFATNRNEVLDVARAENPGVHYALTIDADEVLIKVGVSIAKRNRLYIEDRKPVVRPTPLHLTADGYTLDVEYAGTRYRRLALFRLDLPWKWVGPVHEYLHLNDAKIGHLTAPTIQVFHEGARSRDPDTYTKDATLLEAALAEDPENTRNRFYLAQSYRDAGNLPAALREYTHRAGMHTGYGDERWYSLFQIGRIREWMGEPVGQVRRALLDAYEAAPTRAEPLTELARVERLQGRFASAALYAEKATTIPVPAGALFVDPSAYNVRAWDELCVAAFYMGDRVRAAYAGTVAVRMNPDDERLVENLRMCQP